MILLIAVFGFSLWANENLLQTFPGEILRNEIVEFKPIRGHHFSLEAPQKCQKGAPLEATARFIKCQFTVAGGATATLNVCDDQKTFCKPVPISLLVLEKPGREPVRLVKNQLLNKELKKSLVPGFEFPTPEEARGEALKKGQPVLVMISTDWCPPCNEAKEYLLTSGAFREATKDWYKIYVDGDGLSAAEWDKLVPFSYYPSFVLLNAKMEEVARFNGELRQADFQNWAAENVQLLNDPIAAVRARVLARHEGRFWQKVLDWWNVRRGQSKKYDQVRLLRYALDREDKEVVRQILTRKESLDLADLKTRVLDFRIGELEDQENADSGVRLALLRERLMGLLSGDDWAEGLSRLCEADVKACELEVQSWPQRWAALSARTGLTEAERASMLGEEFYYMTQVFAKLKDPKKQKEFANKCVDAYQSLKKLSQLKLPRSAQQGLVPCLEQAERYQEALTALKTLVEIYPYEPTFMIRLARLYRKQKKSAQALDWMNKAESVAYGYNWFSLVLIKSEILLDLGRRDEAKSLIDSALNEVQLEPDRESRNQRLVARLRAVQSKISN